jgi:hypothetical protein
MPGRLQLGSGLLQRPDDISEVLEALTPLFEPVRVDAGALERLDQLELRAALVQREPE